MKNCNIVMNPVFSTPAFDQKGGKRVHFSITSPAPEVKYQYTYFWQIRQWCKTREVQISHHFDCMESVIPRPNARWESKHHITDLDAKLEIKNWLFGKYCIDEDTKLSVSYFAPERDPYQVRHILEDYCRAYILIDGYNLMKMKPEYRGKELDYATIIEFYKGACTKNKLIECTSEYTFNKVTHTMNCVTMKQIDSENKASLESNSSGDLHWHYAKFALLSYSNSQKEPIDVDWIHIESAQDSDTGFFADAFMNFKTKSVVIAFRGTDDYKDWLKSNRCFLTGCLPAQYKNAEEFTYKIIEKQGREFSYVLVGHSLGGGLAQLVAIKTAFSAVTFDAPGVLKVAKNYFSSNKIIEAEKNIKAFIHGYDLVNMFGTHIVPLIQIIPENFESICKKYYETEATLDQHNMQHIADMFDRSTGYIYSNVSTATILDTGVDLGRNEFQKMCSKWFYNTHGKYDVIRDIQLKISFLYTIIYNNNTEIVLHSEMYTDKEQQDLISYKRSQILDVIKGDLPFAIEDNSYSWSVQDQTFFRTDILNVHFTRDKFNTFSKEIVNNKSNLCLVDVKKIQVDLHTHKLNIVTNYTKYELDMHIYNNMPTSMQVGLNLEFIPHLTELSGDIFFTE